MRIERAPIRWPGVWARGGERAQVSVEYFLAAGGFAVLVVAALLVAFPQLLTGLAALVCPSVDTAADPAATLGSCLGP